MIATGEKGRYEAFIGRGLEGFQRRSVVELQPSGSAVLDVVLCGGFPRGSLVELCGPASSGRTSLAFSLLAQATGRQEACAFVRALVEGFDRPAGAAVRILYGGSLKPDNCTEMLCLPDVDGTLVGGASLDPAGFAHIVEGARR